MVQAGDLPVTVSYTASGITAVKNSDFVLADGSVTIAAGDVSAPIDVTIKGDTVVEDDDTFSVTLVSVTSGPGTVDAANAESLGTIVNDDAYTLSSNSVTVAEGDSGDTPAAFTLSLDQPGHTDVQVAYTVRVPAGVRLLARTTNGIVDVNGLASDVDVSRNLLFVRLASPSMLMVPMTLVLMVLTGLYW